MRHHMLCQHHAIPTFQGCSSVRFLSCIGLLPCVSSLLCLRLTASVASGVTSRGAGPVPPVVTTRQQRS